MASLQILCQQRPPFIQLKPMTKAHFSGKMVSIGISDVVIASVYA